MRVGRALARGLRRGRRRRPGAGAAVVEPLPAVGVCFDETDFSDSGTGAAAGFQAAGDRDFPSGGYELRVDGGVQVCRIDAEAVDNGDAGILRTFEAAEGQVYAVTARARIVDASPGFKARLTIAPKRANGRQLGEHNARLDRTTGDFVELTIPEAVMPPATAVVSVKFRAHTRGPGEHGRAELSSWRFERLR